MDHSVLCSGGMVHGGTIIGSIAARYEKMATTYFRLVFAYQMSLRTASESRGTTHRRKHKM
jgi:hypothetical protein